MRPVNLEFIGLALGGFLRSFYVAWAHAPASSANVLTIAGSGSFFFYCGDDGPVLAASFNGPNGLAFGPDGAFHCFGDRRQFSTSSNTLRT